MTISTEPAPLSYNGDGSTVNFAITWKYFAKSHVVATLRSAAGTETIWALTTNYTLTAAGVDAGGTLTAVVAPATGEKLVITLEPPNTQESSLPLGGPFPSANVEDALDLSAQRDSKFTNLIDRTFRVPVTDTQSGSDLEFPIDSDRANKFLAFDASGNPIASSGSAGVPASTFMETVLDDTSAAAAAATLAVLPLAGGTMTGDIIMSGASVIDANASIAAHATTMDPWSLGNYVTLTGSAVTFTAMANAPQAGAEVELYMNAAHVFTDGAVFEVDGDQNYTATIGDRVLIRAKSTTVFTVHPRKKDGTAVTPSVSDGDKGDITVSGGGATWTVDATAKNSRCWISFNGTGTPAINADAGFDSITDNAVGDWTLNITAGYVADANYAAVGMGSHAAADTNALSGMVIHSTAGAPTTKTTAAIRVFYAYYNVGAYDAQELCVVICGN